MDTAVILAGGKGTRLMPLTADKPKPMTEILGKTLIEWIILWLKKNKIKRIVISVDYKKEVIIKHLKNGESFGVEIIYNHHDGAEGTGDAFRSVLENKNIELPETFLAMNGDQIVNLSIKNLTTFHRKHDPVATIVMCPIRSPFGIIEYDKTGTIRKFLEKPILPDTFMNAGIYIFNKSIKKYLPQKGAIENTTFKHLAKNKKLKAYKYMGVFTTVNKLSDIKEAEKTLLNSKLNSKLNIL